MDAEQTKIYTAVLITAIVTGSILLFFIISLIQQQRRNNRLYTAKIQAEISTLENERTRIAADLHDELGPLLSAIKFKLSSIETGSEEDEQTMQATAEHITDIIKRLREISNDLMPNTLVRKGLSFAIEEFIYKLGSAALPGDKGTGLNIDFRHKDIPGLPKEKAINIYRIIQEIVHNTIKHSGATQLTIELKAEQGKLILMTRDNGKGFNYRSAVTESTGLGLRSVVSRNDVMKGDIFIESQPGKGTGYTIEIPV